MKNVSCSFLLAAPIVGSLLRERNSRFGGVKKKIIGILLALIPFSAAAQSVWHTSTIRTVYPLAEGGFVLIFTTDSPACPAVSPKYHFVMLNQNGMTAAGLKNLYAGALTAAAAAKEVSIYFDPTSTECYVNRMIINF